MSSGFETGQWSRSSERKNTPQECRGAAKACARWSATRPDPAGTLAGLLDALGLEEGGEQ